MKKAVILFNVLVFGYLSGAKAQFSKGTLMVGTTIGSTAYSSANSDYDYVDGEVRNTGTKTYSLSVGPQLGIFVTRNLVVGTTVSFSTTITNTNTTTTTTTSSTGTKSSTTNYTIGLGPFVRYYLANVFAKNLFYLQVNGDVASGSGSSSGSGFTNTNTDQTSGSVTGIFNWNAGGSVGLEHFFDKHVGMDVSLGYLYSSAKSVNKNTTVTTTDAAGTVTTSTSNYNLTTGTNGITLGVGFHWFLW